MGTSGEPETYDGLLKETGTGDFGSGCKNGLYEGE
jgi:hypothetical protein